jgi:hypothetical protein
MFESSSGNVRRLAKRITRAYGDSYFKWRCIDNLSPTLSYRARRRPLEGEPARVVRELHANGICMTSVSALLSDDASFQELRQEVTELEDAFAEQISAQRQQSGAVEEAKTYLFALLGESPTLDVNSVFVRFALQSPILQVANAYFGCWAKLRFYNVWRNFPTETAPQRSQLWHRDREDRAILKMFVYLTDVDRGAGPLTYAPGTHAKGPIRQEADSFLETNRKNPRSTDEQMAAVVPAEKWITAVGPRGTIVFADTHGYHKGGWVRDQERLLYNCMFVSPGARCKEYFQRPREIAMNVDGEQARALDLPV